MYTIDIPKLEAKWKSTPPEWMVRRVQEELAPFSTKKISQEALAKTLEQVVPVGPYARYRIVDGKIYRWGGAGPFGLDAFFRTLGRLSDYPGVPDLPNVDFILGQKDGVPLNFDPPNYWITPDFDDQAPILAFARAEDAPYVVCVPDAFTIAEWSLLSREIVAHNRLNPWKRKKEQAFWRGQVNDFHRNLPPELMLADYSNQPRYRISLLSTLYPDLIDAGFNAMGAAPDYLWSALADFHKPGVSIANHLPYAYLPTLDGAMCTFPGYLWRLLSNCLVMKVPGGIQWFYAGLQPYFHYIPIRSDLSDLVEKITWARAHDADCQQIANTATQFVLDHVMVEDLYYYQLLVLQEYAKYQDFDVQDFAEDVERDPQWVRIR
jgi:hypothetical protein